MRCPAALAITLALGLAGCVSSTEAPIAPVTPVEPTTAAPSTATTSGPVLGPDGLCTGAALGGPGAIEVGIGECDLVRLKGKPPTDVLVGESGRGHREVQVLYSEPGGRELYFFVNNKLDRIVR